MGAIVAAAAISFRILALVLGIVLPAGSVAAQKPPLVAAASDLKFALEAIAAQFSAESGEQVAIVFGSSGNLTRQIVDGAPYELFLSADEAFVEQLTTAGLTRDAGVIYGVGRIVLFAPHGSGLAVDERLDGLRALLSRGGVTRFAIANPQHAPYGRAAEAALRAKGLWDDLRPSLVLGDGVVQAAQFAVSGHAVGGMLAYSLALAPPLQGKGTYALLPETLHPPLRQRMVLLKRAGAVAGRFYAYLQSPAARVVLRGYGFTVPEH